MFKTFVKSVTKNRLYSSRFSSHALVNTANNQEIEILQVETPTENKSPLEPCTEDISHVSTYLKPTFNFAAYVNKSETLQELLKLGVNLHLVEKNEKAVPFILGLKFDDIREHIIFFRELGLASEKVGEIITKNPFILREDLDNLKVRVSYLKFKKFTQEMILRILEKNPLWLSYSTQDIDEKLGFFQKHFLLSGDEIREIATKKPKLITYSLEKVKENTFAIKEEMGFTSEEIRKIILKKPGIFTSERNKLLKTFEYLHNTMKISLERIVENAEILTCRKKRLLERHSFLTQVGRAQYDPKKPNYVALTALVGESDSFFATEVAKSSVQAYNAFLKSF